MVDLSKNNRIRWMSFRNLRSKNNYTILIRQYLKIIHM